MGCLFGDVIATSAVRIVPIAGKGLAENRIEGLLDTTGSLLVKGFESSRIDKDIRWPDMPTTEIEFDDRHKSLQRVVDFRHR